MLDNFRPPSYQLILCDLYFSPFLKTFTLLAMCLVCLELLPLSAIHTENLLSNIIRGSSYGTKNGSLFKNSLIIKLLNPFMSCMLYCINFTHFIEQLILEHVCHGQFSNIDKI